MEFNSTKTERKANNNNSLLRSHNKKHNEKDVMIALKNADDGIVNAVMVKKLCFAAEMCRGDVSHFPFLLCFYM